jgi:hypothetical protein
MEVLDAEARGDHGVIFKKVGPDLRVVPGGFADTIPVQAVAISNKFGLTFFLHSQGKLSDWNALFFSPFASSWQLFCTNIRILPVLIFIIIVAAAVVNIET